MNLQVEYIPQIAEELSKIRKKSYTVRKRK